jgi:Cu/Ag efflux pump CusA
LFLVKRRRLDILRNLDGDRSNFPKKFSLILLAVDQIFQLVILPQCPRLRHNQQNHFVGQDFFPQVDAGQFRLHVRAPAGTRLEKTEQIFTQVENEIRLVIPEQELEIILDNIGLPVGGVNLAFSDTATIGAGDGEILVGLKEGKHHSTWQYVRQLRQTLTAQFPELTFFFQPADKVVNKMLL